MKVCCDLIFDEELSQKLQVWQVRLDASLVPGVSTGYSGRSGGLVDGKEMDLLGRLVGSHVWRGTIQRCHKHVFTIRRFIYRLLL